jgi:hypothetical protein
MNELQEIRELMRITNGLKVGQFRKVLHEQIAKKNMR